jgi:predicted enzyme related to lactoylglutathione lyase
LCAAAFYAGVLGWEAEAVEEMDYTVFNNDGAPIAGAMKPAMPRSRACWKIAIPSATSWARCKARRGQNNPEFNATGTHGTPTSA